MLRLYSSVGWTAYTRDPDTLMRGLAGSLLAIGAFDGDELIGLIRVVGDAATIICVQDILVDPAYQRRGVGRRLMQAVLDRYGSVRQFVLCSDDSPEANAFYRAMGLKPMPELGCVGWIRMK
ncbi:MAG: GNAT family N-acetyltransferase [Clostridia bacterium]|nr:GNAT family N-acetyltransferase [Clostridia bacterium]